MIAAQIFKYLKRLHQLTSEFIDRAFWSSLNYHYLFIYHCSSYYTYLI